MDVKQIELCLRVAYHEVGHVVVGAALACPVEGVYITGRPPIAEVRHRKPIFDLDEVRRNVAMLMAGYLAERRIVPDGRAEALAGAKDDFARVRWWDPGRYPLRQTIVRYYFSRTEDWNAFVREQVRMANRILRANWEAVGEIAMALLWEGSLEGRKLKKMLKLVEPHMLEPSQVFEAMHRAA